jgi:hypothetical protein
LGVAVLCGCAIVATAASAGSATTKHHATARGKKTYSTRATIPLRTALYDPFVLTGAQRSTGFAMARASGASYIRVVVLWELTAPSPLPDGFVASDPNSPGYNWGYLDETVRAAEAAGLTPILDITNAPSWAMSVPPKKPNGGTPSSTAIGQFARALATRYDGNNGVPAVHVFEVWNEPNLSLDLSPVKPATYRGMVNSVAASVHAVSRRNIVVAGGLDPYGHPKGKKRKWYAARPLAYMRALLCISKGAHPHATCHSRIHFDVWSHHPYSYKGPFGHAALPDDVSLGDLPEMRAVLQKAWKVHHIVAAHAPQFWVTEFGWDTNPPRHHAVPLALDVRWTAESLYQMWRSGVSLVTWFVLQDQHSPSQYQSGLYFYSANLAKARAKPVRTAFRFPFVAYLDHATVSVWGRDATSAKAVVTIQRRRGAGPWRTVARVKSNRYGIFKATLRLKATVKDRLRARAPGSGTSAAFSLKRPSPKLSYSPWGF